MRSFAAVLGIAAVVGVSAGCAPGGRSATGVQGARPRSTATLTIREPTPGEVLAGTTVHVQLALTGGQITPLTSTNLRPDLGHIHLSIDGKVISMTYGLEQDIAVAPGPHLLTAEYVATDHFPFNPRVIRSVTFTVR